MLNMERSGVNFWAPAHPHRLCHMLTGFLPSVTTSMYIRALNQGDVRRKSTAQKKNCSLNVSKHVHNNETNIH